MSSLSPAISLTSTIIGFISFGLTILIWLHSFWNAFQTVAGAHRQIQDELSLLRQRLYEEAEYLRMLRRRERPKSSDRYGRSRDRDWDRDEKGGGGGYHSSGRPKKDIYNDGGPIRVLWDAVKDLIKDFKTYEHPFLVIPGQTDEEGGEKELEWSYGALRQNYQCDLPRRLVWLKYRSHITDVSTRLEKIQTHRAAIESTRARLLIIDAMGLVRDCNERIMDVEDRVRVIEDRVMGARVVRAQGF